MPWPKGKRPTWDVGRLPDTVPCPRGHVGEFTRGADGRRKCRVCNRVRMKLGRLRCG